MFQKTTTYLAFCLFLLFCYFTIFHHLGLQPIQSWDEGLFAMRAYFLAETGQLMPNFAVFDEHFQHPNIKPPFTTYFQALSFKTLGYNELALRLPIALIVFSLVLGLWSLGKIYFKDTALAYFAPLVLLTSSGFVRLHVSRTGDHDAAIAAYLFFALIAWYAYLHTSHLKRRKWYLAAFTFLLFATAMTKSTMMLLFLPGFALYTLYQRQLLRVLKRPQIYLAIVALIGAIALLLWHIESQYGFLGHFLQSQRFSQAVDNHKGPFYFYLLRYWDGAFQPWLLFLPLGLLIALVGDDERIKNFSLLGLFCYFPTLLVLSLAKTKLFWYDATLFPIMAFWTAIALSFILKALWAMPRLKANRFGAFLATMLFVLVVFGKPLQNISPHFMLPENKNPSEQFAYILEKHERRQLPQKDFTLLYNGHNPHMSFYQAVYQDHHGYEFDRKKNLKELELGEMVMMCSRSTWDKFQQVFEYDMVLEERYCRLVRVKAKKQKD